MSSLTVDVADRLHAIHGTMVGVTAERYFPERIDTAMLPLITAMAGRRTFAQGAARVEHSVRLWTLMLICGAWIAGLPTATAQANAESLIDVVTDAYRSRPRLELVGMSPLGGVVRARLLDDGGIESLENGANGLAVVRWTLEVTTHVTFAYASES
jgi:hypothetical protein